MDPVWLPAWKHLRLSLPLLILVIGGWWLTQPAQQAPGTIASTTLRATRAALTATAPQPPSPLTGEQRALRIDLTAPVSQTLHVPVDTSITIGFDRPAVLLESTTDHRYLPQPVRLEPAVTGQGEWTSPNHFRFQPDQPLAGGTTYRVWVVPFVGLDQRALAAAHSFTFTTALPLVVHSEPTGTFIHPRTPISVTFDQAMAITSTQSAFTVQELSTKRLIRGEVVWLNGFKTLKFFPDQPLKFDEIYLIGVAASAQPASQLGGMQQEYRSQFATLPLPYVESVHPAPNQHKVGVDEQITLRFSTYMSLTSVLERIRIEPAITPTLVYSSYAPLERTLTLGWPKAPSTTYTVTLAADLSDQFGNRLGDTVQRGAPIVPTGASRATRFSFTTGDLPAFARLNISGLTHFSAYTTTNVGLYYRNITHSQVSLYQVPLSEFARLSNEQFASNQWSYQHPDPLENLLWTRRYALEKERNTIYAQKIPLLDQQGKRLPPGLYLLEATAFLDPAQGNQPLQALIVLSNGNLVVKQAGQGASLAWLTDLRTGNPVAGRELHFLVNGFLQSETQTDRDGLARADLQLGPQQSRLPVLVVSGQPGAADFAVGASHWNQGIGVGEFGLSFRDYSQKHQLHFYTDRPIYRPGQRVYWKGIIRRWRAEEYELPAREQPVTVQLRDGQGTLVAESSATISPYGTVDGSFDLNPEALTGEYTLNAIYTQLPHPPIHQGVSLLVAAYRKPEFAISVRAAQPEVIQGDTVRVQVAANYFSGGPLTGAKVHWRLIAAPYLFNQTANDRFYTFNPLDPDQGYVDPYTGFTAGLVKEGDGEIGADGAFTLTLPADLAESRVSQQWTVDVTVQSGANQFVNRSTTLLVHRANYYIGISPASYVLARGQAGAIDLITLKPDGAIYAQATLSATIEHYQWHNVYTRQVDGRYLWESKVERKPILTRSVTTDAQGAARLHWQPAAGGQYLLTVRSQDRAGNRIQSAQILWVSEQAAGAYVAWPQPNHDRLALVADKPLYRPGDTAQILVPSPFPGKALVTVEQGGVLNERIIDLTSNSATVAVPILENYVPSVFVSVVIFRAADEANPTPALKVGYVQLKVDSQAKALPITVQASADVVRPGTTVQYTLTVQQPAVGGKTGEPAPNSEVTVALIDKAVLALRAQSTRSLLDIFYYERGLGVTTGSTMIINQDRLSQQIGTGQKGGGGGVGGPEVRQEFPDIAWWRASYVSDSRGQVRFRVPLPDNLTRWVLVVKAVDKATRVGETSHEIVATKDLQVRPLAPRFFTAGDQATLGGLLVNTTARRLADLRFMVELEGASLIEGSGNFSATLGANVQQRLDFPIQVAPHSTQVVVTMTATTTQPALADRVRLVIPVKRFVSPVAVTGGGMVITQSTQISFTLPPEATQEAELILHLQGSLAASLLDGLAYLEHYPYECNEQSLSRFLPNIFTLRTFRSLGLADPALERQLNYQVAVGVQRMLARQNGDGGWGYWPGNGSSTFTTAYVLWGLHQARHFGYPISSEALQRASSWLQQRYISAASAEGWELNEDAFKHFVLAEVGVGDPGQMSVLYDNRAKLGLYGKAFLALAMDKMATGDASFAAAINELLYAIRQAAVTRGDVVLWGEQSQDYWTMSSDVRTSATIVEALLRLRPADPLLPGAVRGLLQARQAGAWGNTQETAWSIIALTDWLSTTHELEGDYGWQAQVNGETLGTGTVDAATLAQQTELRASLLDFLQPGANTLTITRTDPTGRLYYATQLYYPVDALTVAALDQGITLDRFFESSDPSTPVQPGDVISLTVRIGVKRELHHALLELPLPAGAEPIDLRLATESQNQSSDTADKRTWLAENGLKTEYQHLRPTYIDQRDDRIALFATYLPPGSYYITLPIRATTPGHYRVLPAHAEMMYERSVMGRSAGAALVIAAPAVTP